MLWFCFYKYSLLFLMLTDNIIAILKERRYENIYKPYINIIMFLSEEKNNSLDITKVKLLISF